MSAEPQEDLVAAFERLNYNDSSDESETEVEIIKVVPLVRVPSKRSEGAEEVIQDNHDDDDVVVIEDNRNDDVVVIPGGNYMNDGIVEWEADETGDDVEMPMELDVDDEIIVIFDSDPSRGLNKNAPPAIH